MHGYRGYLAAAVRCGIALTALLPGAMVSAHALPDVSDTRATLTAATATNAPLPSTVLGAHTLLTQPNGLGISPAVSQAIDTQSNGSALLVLTGGYASNAVAPADTFSNTWKRVGKVVTYNGYGSSFDVRAYIAMPAKGGRRQQVSFKKNAQPEGEITVPIIEIRHATRLQDVAQNYPDAGLVVTSGSVTTTAPATLLAVWWGDAGVKRMTAVPNNGFEVIESFLQLPDNSGVQCAVAVRDVAAAGTYNVSWTGAPVQGAILWLFAFQSG